MKEGFLEVSLVFCVMAQKLIEWDAELWTPSQVRTNLTLRLW
jgi:hypothetical protein